MTCTSEKYDIKIGQGETFRVGLKYKDAANVNLFATALFANAACSVDENSKTPLMVFDCDFDSNNEILWISLDANTTRPHGNKSGMWDVKVSWQDRSIVLLYGKFRVIPRATK
jgi:hypothetical protein